MTPSAVASLTVEEFLPEAQKTYLFRNYKQSSQYRNYKDLVPEYLRDRPRDVILHCLDRRANSMKFKEHDIEDIDLNNGKFKIIGSSNKERIIDFGHNTEDSMPTCSCPDWEKFHLPCKHFFAIFRHRQNWSWNKLPKVFLESAYLSLDNKALSSYYEESDSLTPKECDMNVSDQCIVDSLDQIPKKKVICVCTCNVNTFLQTISLLGSVSIPRSSKDKKRPEND